MVLEAMRIGHGRQEAAGADDGIASDDYCAAARRWNRVRPTVSTGSGAPVINPGPADAGRFNATGYDSFNFPLRPCKPCKMPRFIMRKCSNRGLEKTV